MIRHDDMDSRESTPIPMSYEDWLAWSSESRQSEWAEARQIAMIALGCFVSEHRLGLVLQAPVEMRLPRSAREPDILFLVSANRNRLTEDRLEGPADLIVEVVSDDSVGRDRVRKVAEYAEAGVREYWIGDPRPGRGTLEGFALGADGYEPIAADADGWIPSRVVPGFRFDPRWFDGNETDLPAALRVVLPERFR